MSVARSIDATSAATVLSRDIDAYDASLAMNLASIAVAALAAGAVLASCGGGGDNGGAATPTTADRRLPLAAEEKLAEARRVVSTEDLRRARPGSLQRAFYDYWSALENEEWTIAIDYFPPETRRRLQTDRLIAALRLEAQTLPVKPLIRRVRPARADQTSVRYFIRQSDGRLRATSMTWRQRTGRWYIAYSSTLDDSYSAAVQQEVQSRSDPGAQRASPEALRAAAAARRAQAGALEP